MRVVGYLSQLMRKITSKLTGPFFELKLKSLS